MQRVRAAGSRVVKVSTRMLPRRAWHRAGSRRRPSPSPSAPARNRRRWARWRTCAPMTLTTTSTATPATAGRRTGDEPESRSTVAGRSQRRAGVAHRCPPRRRRRRVAPAHDGAARGRRQAYALSYLATSALACSISLPPSRPLLLDLVDPGLDHGLGGLQPACAFSSSVSMVMRVAALLDHLAARAAPASSHMLPASSAPSCRSSCRSPALQVGRQALVLRLVHRQEEGRRVERRRARDLGVVT